MVYAVMAVLIKNAGVADPSHPDHIIFFIFDISEKNDLKLVDFREFTCHLNFDTYWIV